MFTYWIKTLVFKPLKNKFINYKQQNMKKTFVLFLALGIIAACTPKLEEKLEGKRQENQRK